MDFSSHCHVVYNLLRVYVTFFVYGIRADHLTGNQEWARFGGKIIFVLLLVAFNDLASVGSFIRFFSFHVSIFWCHSCKILRSHIFETSWA